jgi:hypothetical protein
MLCSRHERLSPLRAGVWWPTLSSDLSLFSCTPSSGSSRTCCRSWIVFGKIKTNRCASLRCALWFTKTQRDGVGSVSPPREVPCPQTRAREGDKEAKTPALEPVISLCGHQKKMDSSREGRQPESSKLFTKANCHVWRRCSNMFSPTQRLARCHSWLRSGRRSAPSITSTSGDCDGPDITASESTSAILLIFLRLCRSAASRGRRAGNMIHY